MDQISNTLDCMHDQQAVVGDEPTPQRKYIVRRLTPLECLRLQGYPDNWFDGLANLETGEYLKKGVSDSAMYKALGNSLAIPCANDVIWRIVHYFETEESFRKSITEE